MLILILILNTNNALEAYAIVRLNVSIHGKLCFCCVDKSPHKTPLRLLNLQNGNSTCGLHIDFIGVFLLIYKYNKMLVMTIFMGSPEQFFPNSIFAFPLLSFLHKLKKLGFGENGTLIPKLIKSNG